MILNRNLIIIINIVNLLFTKQPLKIKFMRCLKLLFFTFVFSACSNSSDDELANTNTTFNEPLLFNKWWYSTTGGTQFYFSSAGKV